MIRIEELDIELDNIDELESILCDELNGWLEVLWGEEDMYTESAGFRFYTQKAKKLIYAKFSELHQLVIKYDPENADDYNIISYMYREE